jgi:hypothetical protein
LNVVTKSLAVNYSADATSIIRNPKLVEYLIGEINGLSATAKGNDLVKNISSKLGEVKTLVSVEKGKPVPQENVKKLAEISAALITSLEGAK